VAASAPPVPEPPRRPTRGGIFLPAPPLYAAVSLVVLGSSALAALVWLPNVSLFAIGFLFVFVLSSVVGGALTTPLATALGGRFEIRRAMFLSLTVVIVQLPIAAAWRGAWELWPNTVPSLALLAVFLVGPAFWFRHLTLYGVSRPSHLRTLPVSLVVPLLYLFALFIIVPPTPAELFAAVAFLSLAFVSVIFLLHAADRPMRREFQMSGVSLIRPLLDHLRDRDAGATRTLEAFFTRGAFPADLHVSLLSFYREGKAHATIALPTVHPGPFAALGASDLPRKLAERLDLLITRTQAS